MAGETTVEERSIEVTPTWAVATVCLMLISVSVLIEHLLHLLAKALCVPLFRPDDVGVHVIDPDWEGLFVVKERCESTSVFDICSGLFPFFVLRSDIQSRHGQDPRRFRFTHQTSFGKRHLRFWSEHSRLLRWPACFLRQFYASVSRTDYLTLRRGFITAHFAKESHFNFQRYINRALEKDFGMVAGMSWWIWIISVLFIFFNAQGFYNYLWLPFIPLVMLLVVGTKLEGIITQMCLDSHGKSQVVIGPLLVRPSDHYFWFNWPKLLLHVIHLVLLQYKFGLRSCFHEKTEDIIIKIVLGVVVHMLCGYVTLPLYALVTQMGSSMKNAVFPESVAHGLKRWRGRARKNLRTNDYYSARPSSVDDASVSLDASLSLDASPSFSLHPSYSVDREGDPPSDLKDTKFVAVEIDDGQVGKQHQKI
ncbi:MLO-like protein 12 [Citrus sinensis]|uniref:MLO-like protein 12 n=1 Tax=Citrus sinensis TaxID=2711 RepID=A0ACB8NH05_CITSI|nr:MLO-like protein 12 [Citrus sinensis]